MAAAYRILKKGGRVVDARSAQHRFEKARELYADHWLGFSEAQLHQLLEAAGFHDIEVTVVSREKETPAFPDRLRERLQIASRRVLEKRHSCSGFD